MFVRGRSRALCLSISAMKALSSYCMRTTAHDVARAAKRRFF
jgi:hypothetical protein